MNWLFFVLIGVIVVAGIIGYIRGFAKMLISTLAVVITLVLVWLISPPIQRLVIEHTNLQTSITEKIEGALFDEADGDTEAEQKIDALMLPQAVTNAIHENIDARPEGTSVKTAVSTMLANVAIAAVIGVILFIIVRILVEILGRLLDKVRHVQGLKQVNGAFGAILAVVEVFLVICGLFFLMSLGSGFKWVQYLIALVEENPVTNWLYHHNPVIYLFNLVKNSLLQTKSVKP